MTTLVMYDDVNVDLIPADAQCIAAYADGRYENVSAIQKRFPKATILKIDVRGAYHNGDALDVEPGDATNSDAVLWFNARRGHTATSKPVLYTSASNVASLNQTMQRAGIKRTDYFVWSAHYTGKQHICGLNTCGYPKADGTQWTDRSHNRSLDESLMEDYVFPKASKPVKPPVKPKNSTNFTVQHTSLDVFHTPAQQSSDALKAFKQGSHAIGGTEGYIPGLKAAAEKYGYWLYTTPRVDGWVAINNKIIKPGTTPRGGFIKVWDEAGKHNDPHPYGNKGVTHATFVHPKLGRISVGTSHYLTKGRTDKQSQQDNPKCHVDHREVNKLIAAAIQEWAKKAGRGSALVFYTMDSNMITRTDDPFFGGDFVTCWKDTKKYPNTGHGNIDLIARHKTDARIHPAHAAKVLELGLASDHKTINSSYYVTNLSS